MKRRGEEKRKRLTSRQGNESGVVRVLAVPLEVSVLLDASRVLGGELGDSVEGSVSRTRLNRLGKASQRNDGSDGEGS